MFFLGEDGEVMGPVVMKHWRQDWDFEPRAHWSSSGTDSGKIGNSPAPNGEATGSRASFRSTTAPATACEVAGATMRASRSGRVRKPGALFREGVLGTIGLPSTCGDKSNHNQPLGVDPQPGQSEGGLAGAEDWGVSKNSLARSGASIDMSGLDFDFSEGDAYWTASQEFWTDVRAGWKDRVSAAERIRIQKTCDGTPSFSIFFELADSVPSTPAEQTLRDAQLSKVLDCVVQNIQK